MCSQSINRILTEPYASLLNGILPGIETGIPRGLYEDFNLTGTSHIIVISGSNISLVQLGVNNPTVSPGLNAQLFKYFAPKYSYLTCYVKQPIFITVGRLTPRNTSSRAVTIGRWLGGG